MTFRFLKIENFFLLAFLLNGLLGCKAKREKIDSSLEHVRLGNGYHNSCYSNYLYHKRLKSELKYLANEFISSCFSDETKKMDGKETIGLNIWEPFSGEDNIDETNIFRIIDENKKKKLLFKYMSHNSVEAGGQNAQFRHPVYYLLPEVFREDGELAGLKVVYKDKMMHLDNELNTLNKDGFNAPEQRWRNSIKQFTASCQGQLLSIRDRVKTIATILDNVIDLGKYSSGAKERKSCCSSRGGLNYKSGFLQCNEQSNVGNENSYAPSDRFSNDFYFEWPICGETLTCNGDHTFAGEIPREFGGCTRCELRWPTNGESTYKPNLQQSVNIEKKSSHPSSLGYDIRLAERSKITCLTPAAARGAVATAMVNRCITRDGSPHCVGRDTNLGRGYVIDYKTPINELYKVITPKLYCEKVDFSGTPVIEDENRVLTGTDLTKSYATTSNLGGYLGFSHKGSLWFLRKSQERTLSREMTGKTTFNLRQTQGNHLYVYRNGRIEIGAGTVGFCNGIVTKASCSKSSSKWGLGVDFYFVSGDAFMKKVDGKCEVEETRIGHDKFGHPEVAGITKEQLKEVCDQLELVNLKRSLVFDNPSTYISDQYNYYKEFIKKDIAKFVGKEFFTLDIESKNIYCADRSKFDEDKITDAMLLSEEAHHLKDISLSSRQYGENKYRVEMSIKSVPKERLFEKVLGKKVGFKIKNFLNQSTKQNLRISNLMGYMVKTKDIMEILVKDFERELIDYECRYVPKTIKYSFKDQGGLACRAEPIMEDSPKETTENKPEIEKTDEEKAQEFKNVPTVKFETVNISLTKDEKGKIDGMILDLDANLDKFRWVRGNYKDMESWIKMFEQGTLTKEDVVKIFTIMMEVYKKQKISGCEPLDQGN